MGSRADQKLKEIEELRTSLGRKLEEIERRFPVASLGRKAAAALVGGGVAAPLLGFVLRRVRGGRRGRSRREAQAPVVVNVFPKSLTVAAVAGIAAWAATRLYETYLRSRGSGDETFRPAVLKPIPEGRQAGGT